MQPIIITSYNFINTPVQRAVNLETTALGAAFLAGLGVGYWQNQQEIQQSAAAGQIFRPRMESTRRDSLYRGWQKAVAATQLFK